MVTAKGRMVRVLEYTGPVEWLQEMQQKSIQNEKRVAHGRVIKVTSEEFFIEEQVSLQTFINGGEKEI